MYSPSSVAVLSLLLRLFIKYQIPSDLLSFSDDLLLPGESGTAEKRLELVKGQVQALRDV